MRVFLDTNIVLDVLGDREPFAGDAAAILSFIERGHASGFIAAHTVTTLFYLLERDLGVRKTQRAIAELLKLVDVVPVDRDRLLHALAMDWKDFEDAVQAACAVKAEVDYLVTRNSSDFSRSPLDVITPPELVPLLLRGSVDDDAEEGDSP